MCFLPHTSSFSAKGGKGGEMSRQEISKVRVAGSLRWLLIKGRMSTAEALRENFLLRDARMGSIFM